jgi:hypothetical protein
MSKNKKTIDAVHENGRTRTPRFNAFSFSRFAIITGQRNSRVGEFFIKLRSNATDIRISKQL